MKSKVGLKGKVQYTLYDEKMKIKQKGKSRNIVTVQGNNYFVDQLSDQGADSIKYMILGTASAAVGSTDTWVGGYFAGNGSAAAGEGTVNPITNSGTPGNLQLVGTWTPGNATQDGITRVGYTNNDNSADGNGTPDNSTTFFIAHGTISPTVNKAAGDTLVVTWDITFAGS